MILPTIHLNGSSASYLADTNRAAAEAVEKAIDAIRHAAPNGRDYYPSGESAAGLAIAEHVERLRTLEKVRDELFVIWEHCDEAVKR